MTFNSDLKTVHRILCKYPLLSGLLITVFVVVGFFNLPEKRRVIYPSSNGSDQIYGYIDAQSGLSAHWVDRSAGSWECHYKVSHSHGCGWLLYWDPLTDSQLDLSGYRAVEITMGYEGPASRVRLFMRNYNEQYAQPNRVQSTKFMSATFPVDELEGPVLIELSELSVAGWWLQEQNIRREWASPEFGHIISIGVDLVEPGLHKAQIKKMVLVGDWIRTELFLFSVIALWLMVFVTDGLRKFYRLYKRVQHERNLVRALESRQDLLEEEKNALGVLADTDPLTGICNRSGLYAQMSKWSSNPDLIKENKDIGVLLLDIDYFKLLNDTHGHDMGDKILKAFSAAISASLRETDIFARWGGEEFVILCQNRSVEGLCSFAEKLRRLTQTYVFGTDVEISITVSIGVALMSASESFDEVLKRADRALYRAKENGRNRVEMAPVA